MLLLMTFSFDTLAQIKIVGNDYSGSLTASKNYYDRDVDFERYFPKISPKDNLDIEFDLVAGTYAKNMTGDTLYLIRDIYLNNDMEAFAVDGNGTVYPQKTEECPYSRRSGKCPWKMPAGYYIIEGYVFGSDERNKIRSSYGLNSVDNLMMNDCSSGLTTKNLKKEILTNEYLTNNEVLSYIRYIVLKPSEDTNMVYYLTPHHVDCRGAKNESTSYRTEPENDNIQWGYNMKSIYFENMFFSLRFYNNVRQFVGKEVTLFEVDDEYDGKYFWFINQNTTKSYIVKDAITNDPIKLLDSKYTCKDVFFRVNNRETFYGLYKEGKLYIVLDGEKTGSFAFEICRINWVRCWSDFRKENPKSKDIPYLWTKYEHDYINPMIIENNKVPLLLKREKIAKAQREKEERQREASYEREKMQEEAEFVNRMTAKYGAKYGELVGKKQVAIGMSKEMCRDAWGRPMNTYRTTTKYGQSEVWCYDYKTRVYFYNEKVVQIDD